MGEYEPEDSREVTQSASDIPVEPERSGVREDDARKRARPEDGKQEDGDTAPPVQDPGEPTAYKPMKQPQQRAKQGESGEGETDKGDRRDHRMAIRNPAGDADPEYDQYALNQPETLDDDSYPDSARPDDDDGDPIAADHETRNADILASEGREAPGKTPDKD